MSIALVGNPNSGKTTLFNALTGGRQRIGNWPGITVDKKEGTLILSDGKYTLTDLPGIYSLDPDTAEQRLARDYLIEQDTELIINIIDSGNLERSLILTLQLAKLGRPMLLVLNMVDELERKGATIDRVRLSLLLKMPVVAISAAKKRNLNELLEQVRMSLAYKAAPTSLCGGCAGCKGCAVQLMSEDIADIVKQVYVPSASKTRDLTAAIDRFALNKWLALPIFLLVMLAVFLLTFTASGWLSGLIDELIGGMLSPALSALLAAIHAPDFVGSLLVDGVLAGVGGVITFLPQIAVLFFLTSFLEDSGYMARAAFIMDKVLSKIGLGGSAFLPLIMGFGCTVPAVMASRALPSEKERRLAIMITPFFSCSARLPVYALFAGAFFTQMQGLVIFSLYFLGIAVAIGVGALLNKTVFKSSDSAFVMEIPPYRLPSVKNLLLHSWERVKGFLIKAGTVLLAASVAIWVFQYFTPTFAHAEDAADSLLAAIGRVIAPVFAPIGLNDWRASVSFLMGIPAKEAIVSTFGVLTGTIDGTGTAAALQSIYSPLQAYVLMAFSLLYIPCVSAIITIRRELNSAKWTAFTLGLGLLTAYVVCLIIYNVGRLFL